MRCNTQAHERKNRPIHEGSARSLPACMGVLSSASSQRRSKAVAAPSWPHGRRCSSEAQRSTESDWPDELAGPAATRVADSAQSRAATSPAGCVCHDRSRSPNKERCPARGSVTETAPQVLYLRPYSLTPSRWCMRRLGRGAAGHDLALGLRSAVLDSRDRRPALRTHAHSVADCAARADSRSSWRRSGSWESTSGARGRSFP